MKGSTHTPEQLVPKLRGGDRELGEGIELAEVATVLESGGATIRRWRSQCGGMKANDAKRWRQLGDEPHRLTRMAPDREPQIEMLKELPQGNPCARIGAARPYFP